MASQFVQVQPDSTGKKIQTFENTISTQVVEAQAIVPVDTSGVTLVGSAGTPTSGVLTMQGVSGGTAVPTSAPDTTASGTLGAANANVQVALAGLAGASIQVAAGTLIGSIIPELSFDGGTTWVATYFDDPVSGARQSQIGFISANTLTTRSIFGSAGASHARVRVSAYSSGTANAVARASNVYSQSVLWSGLQGGVWEPVHGLQLGGWDGANYRAVAASAKGTQGAFGLTVQDLKDSGRQHVMLSWERVAGTAAAESALTNFTNGTRGGAVVTAANNYTVSAGKTLRIQSVTLALTATSTIANNGRFRIRQAASSIANTSPIIFTYDLPWPFSGTVAANLGESCSITIPDGLEVAGGQQITFTWNTSATTCTVSLTILGYEY